MVNFLGNRFRQRSLSARRDHERNSWTEIDPESWGGDDAVPKRYPVHWQIARQLRALELRALHFAKKQKNYLTRSTGDYNPHAPADCEVALPGGIQRCRQRRLASGLHSALAVREFLRGFCSGLLRQPHAHLANAGIRSWMPVEESIVGIVDAEEGQSQGFRSVQTLLVHVTFEEREHR